MLVFVAVFSVSLASAQVSNDSPPQENLITARTNLVLVPALVTTKAGATVFTLTANDFKITDDGVEQKVTLEEDSGGEPLALVVAIETGGGGARQLKNYGSLGPLIEAIVGSVPHRVAVVGFDSGATLRLGFTPDLNEVRSTIGSLEAGNSGAAILDGLEFSVELLRKQPPEYRRAILLISETVDRGSGTKLEDALHVVSDTNTAIYSLAFSTSKSDLKHEGSQTLSSDKPGPPGGCMGKDPNADSVSSENRFKQAYDCLSLLAPPLRLVKMAALLAMNQMHRNVPESVAQLTGGEYFSFNNTHSLERDLTTISNRIANHYVLSFHPQSPHPGLHTLEVRLRDYPNLVVKARSNYWADAKAVAAP